MHHIWSLRFLSLLPQGVRSPIYSLREVGSRRVPRQPGQVRKEAALTSVSRVVRPASHLAPSAGCVAARLPPRLKPFRVKVPPIDGRRRKPEKRAEASRQGKG